MTDDGLAQATAMICSHESSWYRLFPDESATFEADCGQLLAHLVRVIQTQNEIVATKGAVQHEGRLYTVTVTLDVHKGLCP